MEKQTGIYGRSIRGRSILTMTITVQHWRKNVSQSEWTGSGSGACQHQLQGSSLRMWEQRMPGKICQFLCCFEKIAVRKAYFGKDAQLKGAMANVVNQIFKGELMFSQS